MDNASDTSSSEELHLSSNSRLLHQLLVLKVRHIRCISACNVTPSASHQPPCLPSPLPTIRPKQPLQFGYFFSLHLSAAPNGPSFFTSELKWSVHPSWDELNIASQVPNHFHTAKGVVVRVWYKPPPSSSGEPEAHTNTSPAPGSTFCPTNKPLLPKDKPLPPNDKPALTHSVSTPLNIHNQPSPSKSTHARTASYSSPNNVARITRKSNSFEPSMVPSVHQPPQPKGCDGNASPPELLFSWAVCLSGLVPIGKNLSEGSSHLAPNALVFQLDGDMLYTATESILEPIPSLDRSYRHIWYAISLPLSHTKRSYSPNALTKLHQTERDIASLGVRCDGRKEQLEHVGRLEGQSPHQQLRKKIALTKTRLRVAREIKKRETEKLQRAKEKAMEVAANNEEKVMQMMALVQAIGRDKQQLKALCGQNLEKLRELERVRAQLSLRRGHLIKDLAHIYPIVQIGLNEEFSICNLWIPDAQLHDNNSLQTPNFQVNRSKPAKAPSKVPSEHNSPSARQNNSASTNSAASRVAIKEAFHPLPSTLSTGLPHTFGSLSAGLGMAAHLMCLLSGILQVPLRYPMSPMGSLATVEDVATFVLPQDNRKFPLYTRGKEKEKLHFKYAVFLLNKNIAQLHQYAGLPKPITPSATLPNLYGLVMHLTKDKPYSVFELPDLKCNPLLTSELHREIRASVPFLSANQSSPSHSCSSSRAHSPKPSPSPTHGFSSHIPSNSVRDDDFLDVPSAPPLSSSHPGERSAWEVPEGKGLQPGAGHGTLALQSSVSCSLDKGLDHISGVVDVGDAGVNSDNPFQAKGTLKKQTTGSLTNLHKDKPLMVLSDGINFEGRSEFRDDDTTTLLRSWNDGGPSHFCSAYSSGNSLEQLEDCIEATESFNPKDCQIETSKQEELVKNSTSPRDSAKGNKPKSRSFWPFSRSNTNESSGEGNVIAEISEKNVPNSDTKVPISEKNVPNSDIKVPISEKNVPNFDTKVPISEKNVPNSDTKVPISEKNVPNSDTKVPISETSNSVRAMESLKIEREDRKRISEDAEKEKDSSNLSAEERLKAEKLLTESLAALAIEDNFTADLSKFNDLSDVADRASKLGAKNFSFSKASKQLQEKDRRRNTKSLSKGTLKIIMESMSRKA